MIPLSEIHRSPTHAGAVLAAVCTFIVGCSFFIQHVLLVEPCPLCIIQRFTYVALVPTFAAVAMLGARPRVQRAVMAFALLLVLGGGGVAAYQSQLQIFPPAEAAGCSASLSYMLDTLPVTDVIGQLFQAHGDCSDSSFKILGLTMAQGSLVIFTVFLVWLVTALRRPLPRS